LNIGYSNKHDLKLYNKHGIFYMDNWWLLLVEAALALGLFIFIIWWTMFSGKKKDKDNKDNTDEA